MVLRQRHQHILPRTLLQRQNQQVLPFLRTPLALYEFKVAMTALGMDGIATLVVLLSAASTMHHSLANSVMVYRSSTHLVQRRLQGDFVPEVGGIGGAGST